MAKKTIEQKAAEAGLSPDLVKRRMKRGMPEKKALTMPYQAQKAHKKIKADLPPFVQMHQNSTIKADPERKPDSMEKIDAYSDGFILTISIAALGAAIALIIWMIDK